MQTIEMSPERKKVMIGVGGGFGIYGGGGPTGSVRRDPPVVRVKRFSPLGRDIM